MSLIFDTETCGLYRNVGYNKYPDTRDLKAYDPARIVQISWVVAGFRSTRKLRINDYIIKPTDFQVGSTNIHGITHERAVKQGLLFKQVMTFFYEDLKKVTKLIGHNVQFDLHVLTSELYRHGLFDIIMEIEKKQIICTMTLCTSVEKREKPCRQGELYEVLFQKPMPNAHNSKWDVINLYTICRKLQTKRMLSLS